MSSRNFAALIAQLRALLKTSAPLGGLRFEQRAFERAVVRLELQGMHHESELPDRARLFASSCESLGTLEEMGRLLALVQAAPIADEIRALAVSLLAGGVPPKDNPVLKLVFAAQYEEMIAARRVGALGAGD